MAMTTGHDLDRFDLFDPVIQQAPHSWYEQMRPAGVHYVAANDIYLVLGYDLVLEVIRDTETFSSRWGTNREPPPAEIQADYDALMATALPTVPTMLDNDPPGHARYRRLVNRSFTPKMVGRLRPMAEAICDRLIDQWIDAGRVEFTEAFAVPLPVQVIAHALNVPEERKADFKRWSDDNIAAIGAKLSPQDYLASQRGIVEMQRFFVEQFEARRAAGADASDDLLTDLLHAHQDEGEDPLTMPELVRVVQMLLVAGNETTTKFLTETLYHLSQGDHWQHLRAHPELVPNVVEEGLRLSSPTQGMYRLVTKDVELGGVSIQKGAKLVIMFASANRDEALFGCPHEFQSDRPNARDHMAFGKGTHYCVGANLSRMEGNVAFERLTQRLAAVRVTPDNDLAYAPSFMLRGLKRLTVEFDPA
jgi:cytochrome P450